MKRVIICFFLLYISFFTAYSQQKVNHNLTEKKSIFLLQSYHPSLPWSVSQKEGYSIYLSLSDYELCTEYLDSKRFPLDQKMELSLITFFNNKYKYSQFDILLITDNTALAFINKYYQDLPFIHNCPIVVNGINLFDKSLISNIPDAIVIKEYGSRIETIKLILSFYPDLQNLYFLNDQSVTGLAIDKSIRKDMKNNPEIFKNVEITFSDNLPFNEVVKELKNLPEKSAILIGNYYLDSCFHYISVDELNSTLSKEINTPIFSLSDYNISGKIIGGKVISGKQQGERLGEIANAILKGKDYSSLISNYEIDPGEYIINYLGLAHYDLLDVPLPKGSIVINKPESLYEKNKLLFNFIALVIFSLLIIIVLILYLYHVINQRYKKQKANTERLLEKFQAFIRNVPIGYVEIDSDSKINAWNNAAENIFGYTAAEAIGQYANSLIKTLDNSTDFISSVIPSIQNHYKSEFYNKNGKVIYCEWYFTNFNNPIINKTYNMCVVIDVTKNENLMRDLQFMVETNKKIILKRDRFIASSMHDLKNLMTPLLAYSELMLAKELPPHKIKSISEQLNKSANVLVEVFKELSDIGKIRSDIMECQFAKINLLQLVNLVLSLIESSYVIKNIALTTSISPDIHVYADREMISSVFMNIIGNAIKFTFHDGKIHIQADLIDAKTVEVRIIDNGMGIDLNKFDELMSENHIFTSEGTDGEPGSGLGLILCKELIEKNHGTFYAELNPQGGSIICFTIPLFIQESKKVLPKS